MNATAYASTCEFYRLLRREVSTGNSHLSEAQQARLQSHYPIMMAPDRYPEDLVTTIYASRRAPMVESIRRTEDAVVFDAGCGYGSESFLFAAAGARVLAVDRSPEQVAIAKSRQPFFEEQAGASFDIEFLTGDLDAFTPDRSDLSHTWLASVLAVVVDQEDLLRRVYRSSRPGGEILITDMNLLNPLFLLREWQRRRRLMKLSSEFRQHGNFPQMVRRNHRKGARYFETSRGSEADDVQFFYPRTLAKLLRSTGFEPTPPSFSGFMPPLPLERHDRLERFLARLPLIRRFGYFYLMSARKT
ncbi:MAG: class I SAM-dependent methyltransferase [Acidobacteriota bacterium]